MKRTWALGIGTALGAAATALVTTAVIYAHGGDATRIHACIGPQGNLRITADPTPFGSPSTGCGAGEHALDWSVTGPAGPAGAAGPAGPAGTAGPAGAAGPAGVVAAHVNSATARFTFPAGRTRFIHRTTSITLPAGRWVVIGKVQTLIGDNDFEIECRLETGSVLDSGITRVGDSGGIKSVVSLLATLNLARGTTVELVCHATGGRDRGEAAISNARIAAFQVNTLVTG